MKELDRDRFKIVVAALCSAFRRDCDQPMLTGYWWGLSDLSIEDVEHAASRAMRDCEFMPVPATLRELAGEVPIAGRAVLAWECVDKAMTRHGCYATVCFDDPVVNLAIRTLGGWLRLGEIEEGDQWNVWTRKEFIATYEKLAAARRGSIAPLVGILDKTNAPNGYDRQPVRRIETGLRPLVGIALAEAAADLPRIPREVVDVIAGIGTEAF